MNKPNTIHAYRCYCGKEVEVTDYIGSYEESDELYVDDASGITYSEIEHIPHGNSYTTVQYFEGLCSCCSQD